MSAEPPARRPFLTPGASPRRRAIERRSATLLLFIKSLPRAVPPLVVVALLAGGLLLEGPAAALCLALVMALFGWLLYLSWPILAPPARLLRIAVLAAMALGLVLNAAR